MGWIATSFFLAPSFFLACMGWIASRFFFGIYGLDSPCYFLASMSPEKRPDKAFLVQRSDLILGIASRFALMESAPCSATHCSQGSMTKLSLEELQRSLNLSLKSGLPDAELQRSLNRCCRLNLRFKFGMPDAASTEHVTTSLENESITLAS